MIINSFVAYTLFHVLQAIEILTGCYILVQVFIVSYLNIYILYLLPLTLLINVIYYCCCLCQWKGNTVAAMGSYRERGLKQVRRIVEDCIKNVKHPVYHIKVTGFTLPWCYFEWMFTRNRLLIAYRLLFNYIGTPNQTWASKKSCSSHWKLG